MSVIQYITYPSHLSLIRFLMYTILSIIFIKENVTSKVLQIYADIMPFSTLSDFSISSKEDNHSITFKAVPLSGDSNARPRSFYSK